MAGLAQTPRTASRAPEKKKEPAQRKAAPAASQPPAYLQKKMALSQPGDKQEQQADHVAQQVARAVKEPKAAPGQAVQRASLEPGVAPGPVDQRIALKATPAAQEVKPPAPGGGMASRKAASPAKEERAPVARKVAPGTSAEKPAPAPTATPGKEAKVARAADPDGEGPATASTPGPTPMDSASQPAPEAEVDAGTQAQIEALKGRGEPLPEALRAQMEAQFDHPFEAVRIHTDPEAARLCTQLRARAFTVGNDIFFAQGAFAPERSDGVELIAHELTHVVQQADGAARLQRLAILENDGQPHPAGSAQANAYRELLTLDVPAPKAQHAEMYRAWATARRLKRPAGQKVVRKTKQKPKWMDSIAVDATKVQSKLQEKGIAVPTDPTAKVAFSINGREHIERTVAQLTELVKIPTWDRMGSPRQFQVDHKVEYQVASEDPQVDMIINYELFDPFLNGSSGGGLMVAIRRKVQSYLTSLAGTGGGAGSSPGSASGAPAPGASWKDAENWLAGHAIEFDFVQSAGGVANVEIGSWSVAEVERIDPLDRAREAPDPSKGRANEFVLASGAGGFQFARLNHSATQTSFEIPAASQGAIAGLRMRQIALNGTEGSAAAGTNVGTLQATWNLPPRWQPANPDINMALKSGGEYIGYPDQIPALALDFHGLSAVSMDSVTIEDGQLSATGRLTPSLSLFNAPIMVTLHGGDLRFSITYTAGEIRLPVPGVTIDDASVSLFYSTEQQFGATGALSFSVPRLGGGNLSVTATQANGLEAAGTFDFDSTLFDRASVNLWYRAGVFGGSGDLAITSPNKIRGIRSASLSATFSEGAFSAKGEVQPNIPGVQQAGLTVSYAKEDGLTIGGNLQLAPNPAIRSGSVDVTLRKRDDVWKVGATGTAVPAIPGVDSQLTVSYDDGAFLAEFHGAFHRGVLDGTVEVGATNRSLDAQGRPTGEPVPGAPLIVYGSGSAALRIAPWLQATAGVQFAPNGEVTVAGRIGLPSSIELFARRQVQKPIFNVAVQIPIIPGIVAEVGGNLSATAGFGPGTLEQLELGISYNPAHEENTTVTGDARFVIPADAGLRLAARAGIGLGITGASATGGLELGGQLGIGGRAEASAHVVWSPAAGLDLTAQASITAQPKFKFDVSGYVSVRALGFSVYDNTWQLAAYEVGSNLTFGVAFPIHYHEGQPFAVSLDDVTFQVPDVDPAAVIRDLAGTLF